MTYGKSEERRASIRKEALSLMFRRLAPFVPRMKHASFSEEREWRLVAIPLPAYKDSSVDYRASLRGILPYVRIELADDKQPVVLDRVYIGPTQNPHRGLSVAQAYLAKHGYSPDIVLSSAIPFRGSQ